MEINGIRPFVESLKYGFNWSSYRSNFKDKYYFKIYSLYSSNIFEGIGMLLRKCGWKWMEISHEKLNLQFLFDISLLVSPFLSTPSRLYRFLSFSFSSRKIILFFISLSLFLIIFIPTLVFLSFMRIYHVQIFDRNYNDRNGRFYRSHANLEFRLLFP